MHPILGSLLIAISLILVFAPVPLAFLIENTDLVQHLAFWLWALAGLLMFLGRSLSAESAEQLLEDDQRTPILYLRSFRRDMADSARFLLALIFRNRDLGGRSREEELVERLGAEGPVISVGRPGEHLPPLGAARRYLSTGGNWQQEVSSLMQRAQRVVVRGSGTQGLLWELQEVVRVVEPRKIELVFDHRWDYECFYTWAWPLFPNGLPDEFPGSSLCFADDWSPVPGEERGGRNGVISDKARAAGLSRWFPAARWSPLPPPLQITMGSLGVFLTVLLALMVTSVGRAQISGWLYAWVSTIGVIIVCVAAETVVLKVMDSIAPGDIILGGLPRLKPSLLRSAMLTIHDCHYTAADHFHLLIRRATAIEQAALERQQAARDSVTENLASCYDTRTGESLLDILKADAFGFRAVLRSLGLQQYLIIRLSSIIFAGIAWLVIGANSGRFESWVTWVGIGLLGAASGAAIAMWAGRGRFITFFQHRIFEGLSDADRAFLERLSGKPVQVRSRAEPRFYSSLAVRIAKWGLPTLALHLVLLPVVFGFAAVVTVLWPGTAEGWSEIYLNALVGTAIGCGVYVLSASLAAVAAGRFLAH